MKEILLDKRFWIGFLICYVIAGLLQAILVIGNNV